jgi:hypothetical protein
MRKGHHRAMSLFKKISLMSAVVESSDFRLETKIQISIGTEMVRSLFWAKPTVHHHHAEN